MCNEFLSVMGVGFLIFLGGLIVIKTCNIIENYLKLKDRVNKLEHNYISPCEFSSVKSRLARLENK